MRLRDTSEIPGARVTTDTRDTPSVSSTPDVTERVPPMTDRIALVQGDLPPSAGTSDRPASGTAKKIPFRCVTSVNEE